MPVIPAFLDPMQPISRQITGFAWGETPLGDIAAWPAALKIAAGLTIRSGFPKCLCWGQDLIAIYNDPFRALLGGKGDCMGLPFPAIWAETWDRIEPYAAAALRGDSSFVPDCPLTVQRGGRAPQQAWFTFSFSPVVDESGTVCGVMKTVIETTARVESEQMAAIRNQELRHRIKNSYTMLAALTKHSFREFSDPAVVRDRLLGRVQALGRVQDALSTEAEAIGCLREILIRALSPMLDRDSRRFQLDGPSLALNERQAFALSLAIHELLTNAVKYGALSTPQGRVAVRWSSPATGPLQLEWVESGGPAVLPPESAGFGTFLIQDALAAAFGGRVDLDYHPAGFRLRLAAGQPPNARSGAN